MAAVNAAAAAAAAVAVCTLPAAGDACCMVHRSRAVVGTAEQDSQNMQLGRWREPVDEANGPHLDPKRHWSRRQAHPSAQTRREKAMRQGEWPDCASPEAQKSLPGTAIGRDRGRNILDASRLGLLGSSQVFWRAARRREWLAGCAIIFLCVSYSAAQPTVAGRPPSGSRGYNAPMPPTQAPQAPSLQRAALRKVRTPLSGLRQCHQSETPTYAT